MNRQQTLQAPPASFAREVLALIRPHQTVKNGFVFVGLIFAQRWQASALYAVGLTFLAFCAAASSAYVFNDILDLPSDRQHPVKCRRPIARGAVSVAAAWRISALLAAAGGTLALCAGARVLPIIAAYLLLNLTYSISLKHVVILDVFAIAAGFMLRILGGTVGVGIPPSKWLLLTGFMLALFLGFAKRRAELRVGEDGSSTVSTASRPVLGDYSPEVLDLFLGITAACTILSYGLYTVSPETIAAHHGSQLFYSAPLVVYGIFRYVFLLHRRARGNDAARDLLTDPHLVLVVVAWLALTVALLA
jgi:4-hydroxybenzoate polyprenyltransferase